MADVQHIRLRRPPTEPKAAPQPRHTGILQDQLRRAARRPWNPSFSLAVRILLLMRVAGAMYSNIDDCDEVFNFWEPLHLLDHGYGFQTWETSPRYAIRSWAYIVLHLFPTRIAKFISEDKRVAFFAVRITLAVISVFAEATLYRAVHKRIQERVGRYLFFMLLCSAGMWNATAAFLPSSFAMYMTTFAFAYSLEPPKEGNFRRTLFVTLFFATGAVVGWPFALALSIPFVCEELFVFGADHVPAEVKTKWMMTRWKQLLMAGLAASLLFIPVIAIDSVAYGKWTIVPWNIVQYNVFGGSERGPELYGTSPWNFYLLNLGLNFNILTPLAICSLPALAVTYYIDRKRLGFVTVTGPERTSPYTTLAIRLAPFYVWLGILTAQAHKEERFMFPAYPLLCFNAAVALYLMRGWLEKGFITYTKSPYQASKTMMFRTFTSSVVITAAALSLSRILALIIYYHSPLSVMHHLQTFELPRLLNDTGLLPVVPPGTPEEEIPRVDLSLIKQFNLTLCTSKEWHRFPGHYLVPDGIRVDFVKSQFDGLLPGHFGEGDSMQSVGTGAGWWDRPATRQVPDSLNDLNKEQPAFYVPIESCDYLIDLDFPLHPSASSLEPRYSIDAGAWDRVYCTPFLDARHSNTLTRTLWLPAAAWQNHNEFGDYCLLKNLRTLQTKEQLVSRIIAEFTT